MSTKHISSINLAAFFLFLTIHATTPSTSTSLWFNLSSITFSDSHRLNITGDAYITDQGIQVTPNNRDGASGGRAGRATYIEPLHLWDKASDSLIDFSTHFSFFIDSNGSSQPHGDGVAFFMAPIGSSIKSWSYGGSLGLGNATKPMNPSSLEVFVAVEFDTFYNADYDPSVVPHVGIDINRMISVTTARWDIDVSDGALNDAWISYNASSKILSVEFSNATTQRGSLAVEVDLREYLPEYVTVGFSASTGLDLSGCRLWASNDVYNFSVVFLEIACGRKAVVGNVALVVRVRELHRDGQRLDAADSKVPMSKSNAQNVHQMLKCAHSDSGQRPTVGQAI